MWCSQEKRIPAGYSFQVRFQLRYSYIKSLFHKPFSLCIQGLRQRVQTFFPNDRHPAILSLRHTATFSATRSIPLSTHAK
jgi:hypothetical protein